MEKKVMMVQDYLNNNRIRCTYNAVAKALGVTPAGFKKLLGDRVPENSWFVNASAGEPVGYAAEEKHPELYRTSRIITSAEVLTRNLDLK